MEHQVYGMVLAPVFYDKDFYGFPDEVLLTVMILLIAVLLVFIVIHNHCKNKIRRDPRLNEALNSEMYRYNELRAYKATATGIFFAFLVLTSNYMDAIPSKLLFFVLAVVWSLISCVAWLVYNK